MTHSEAQQIVASGNITFGMIRTLLNGADNSDELSTNCSGFTKTYVRDFMLAAIRDLHGRIEPGTLWAEVATWALIEFG